MSGQFQSYLRDTGNYIFSDFSFTNHRSFVFEDANEFITVRILGVKRNGEEPGRAEL